jgi:hypothetical protein
MANNYDEPSTDASSLDNHNTEDLPEDGQDLITQQRQYLPQFPRRVAYDELISDSAVSLDASDAAPP